MADGIQMQPTNGRPASPGKRRPEGKEGLLAQKPPPLEGGGRSRRMRGMRGCCSYIPFVSIIGLALLLAGLALYGHEGRAAARSTDNLVSAALGPNGSSNGMVGHAKYSYHAAYVSTVVIGTCILAFTIGILIWRMFQRRRTESLNSRGAGSHAQHRTLESLGHALGVIIYVFCAWLLIWFAINILILAGVYIAHAVSHYADSAFGTTLVPLLNNWLNNASVSYNALNELLAEVPAIGSQAQAFTNTAFGTLIPTPPDIASYLNNHTGNQFSYLINQLLGGSGGVPGQCSATGCIDLSKYPFMNSNSCICNSPALGQIANSAGSAARHYMRAAIGLFIAYLGSSLLLARMSAEAAKVRYESHLLWTNKLDRLMMRRQTPGQPGSGGPRGAANGNGTVGGSSNYVI